MVGYVSSREGGKKERLGIPTSCSLGCCLNPKACFDVFDTPYHPFSTPWKSQVCFFFGGGGGGSDLDSDDLVFFTWTSTWLGSGDDVVFFFCWGVGRERFIWDPQTISMKKSDHHDIDHPDGWIGLFASLLPSNHNNSIYTYQLLHQFNEFLQDNIIPWLLQRHVTYSEATTEANPSNYSFFLSTCPLLFCLWFPSKLAVHGPLNQLVLGIVSQTLSPNVGLVTNSFSGIACHCPKMVLFFLNVKTLFFVGGFPASYCLILYTPED